MQKYLKYIIPFVLFVVLIFISNSITEFLSPVFASSYRVWFDFFINSIGQELLRQVDVNSSGGNLVFLTAFVDLNNLDNFPIRTTEIEIFNEILLPIIFYVSICFSFLNKKNIKWFFINLFILLSLLWLKNIIVIYDNYTNPEYVLKELIFPFEQLVYYINSILVNVGTTFGIMLSLIISVIFLVINSNLKKYF